MKKKIKLLLFNKKGNAVQAIYIIFFVIIVMLFLIQIVTLYTSAYKVRDKSILSLSLLEAAITEETYESLTDKNFDFYQNIVETNDDCLSEYYYDKYIDIFEKSLECNLKDNEYVGPYYKIDPNTIKVTVQEIDDNYIRLNLEYKISYDMTVVGFNDVNLKLINETVKVSSDYNFHGDINSDDSEISGNSEGYENRGL